MNEYKYTTAFYLKGESVWFVFEQLNINVGDFYMHIAGEVRTEYRVVKKKVITEKGTTDITIIIELKPALK